MAKKAQNSNKRMFSMSIPRELEKALVAEYGKVISRYQSRDFEYHEASVGKFCEVVLRIFEYILTRKFTPIGECIPETRKVLNKVANDKHIDTSLRKRVTSLIDVLLGFRNERDAAHVGGIDLESIDTNFTFYATRWIYAELIRVYGDMGIRQMQQKIDESAEIMFPDLLKIGDKKIITNPRLTSEKEVLLSLEEGEKTFEELFEMNKERNKTRFKKKLEDMVKRKLIYNNQEKHTLLPEGRKKKG